jgi:hypothetical protein
VPSFPFIQKGQIGPKLQGQRDRLWLAPVQITSQDRDQSLVLHRMPLNPVGCSNLIPAWPMLAPGIQLLPNCVSNVQTSIQLVEKGKLPYCGQIRQW